MQLNCMLQKGLSPPHLKEEGRKNKKLLFRMRKEKRNSSGWLQMTKLGGSRLENAIEFACYFAEELFLQLWIITYGGP